MCIYIYIHMIMRMMLLLLLMMKPSHLYTRLYIYIYLCLCVYHNFVYSSYTWRFPKSWVVPHFRSSISMAWIPWVDHPAEGILLGIPMAPKTSGQVTSPSYWHPLLHLSARSWRDTQLLLPPANSTTRAFCLLRKLAKEKIGFWHGLAY